jgi:hypothetical protein
MVPKMAETMEKRGETIGKTREDCRENNGENYGEHGKTMENHRKLGDAHTHRKCLELRRFSKEQ